MGGGEKRERFERQDWGVGSYGETGIAVKKGEVGGPRFGVQCGN